MVKKTAKMPQTKSTPGQTKGQSRPQAGTPAKSAAAVAISRPASSGAPKAEPAKQILLRSLPQVGELLNDGEAAKLVAIYGQSATADALRHAIGAARQEILAGHIYHERDLAPERFVSAALAALTRSAAPNLCHVVNGTGVILHTSLGRAVLAKEAWDSAAEIARGYSMLELDRESGKRGDRDERLNGLICELTGADAATVLNNNAAATMLLMNTLSEGKETIISRAHMVEIGGSYRMMDVMYRSGAIMREVGTTNKGKASDYEAAVGPNTGCIVKVHTSNYKIMGFTEYATLEELAAIGRRHNVPVMYDLGAGSLVDLRPFGLDDEPVVPELVRQGADVVCFSGDKLLGGPQAGICVGRKDIIAKLKKNQMFRMMRCDKITLALLEATLKLYRDPKRVFERVPTLRMISEPLDTVLARANRLKEALTGIPRVVARVIDHEAFVGGGSLPTERMPSMAVHLAVEGLTPDALATALRIGEPSVFGRIVSDMFLLDCRTLADNEIAEAATAVRGLRA